MDSRAFFSELTAICNEINKQIPLTANRDEEYECCPRDADQDEIDRLYELHEARWQILRMQDNVYRYATEVFQQYLHEKNISNASLMDSADKQACKNRLLTDVAAYTVRLNRALKLVHATLNSDAMQAYLFEHAEEIIDKLCRGQTLAIDDEKIAKRFAIYTKLGKQRERMQQQFFTQNQMAISGNHYDDSKFRKVLALWDADYLIHENTDAGFCGEHAYIAVNKILSRYQKLHSVIKNIEIINISYEEGDGHVFLAINRDQNSKLNDFSTWGKEAILFDSWNKLVCWAEEYASLPTYYFSFPDAAEWKVYANFTGDDYAIYSSVSDIQLYFRLTGKVEFADRYQYMLAEFQLTDLDDAGLSSANEFLNKIVNKFRPADLQQKVKLYITTTGNELVSTLCGFPDPVITIHRDFLAHMGEGGIYSIAELEFAIARILLEIQNYGSGMGERLTNTNHNKLDQAAAILTGCHDDAIAYLRKSNEFYNKHDEVKLQMADILFTHFLKERGSYDQRIRSLFTCFAQLTHVKHEVAQRALSRRVVSEVEKIQPRYFYQQEVNACADNAEKINYLTSRVPELGDELLPFDLTREPSARVREFCSLLRAMKIDFSNPAEEQAANELIDKTFQLRLSAVEVIYLALFNKEFTTITDYRWYGGSYKPLGPFKRLEEHMKKFLAAEHAIAAENAAREVIALYKNLEEHFPWGFSPLKTASWRMQEYVQAHGGSVPPREERYFATGLGIFMKWPTFSGDIHAWDKHMTWMKELNSKDVATALRFLGVQTDMRLYEIYSQSEIKRILSEYKEEFITKLSGDLAHYSNFDQAAVAKLAMTRHALVTDMFEREKDFEQAFISYYDLNWPDLRVVDSRDADAMRSGVKYLLKKFAEIANNGSECDRNVVKSFFIGRDDERDLNNLQYRIGDDKKRKVYPSNKSPYVDFVIDQEIEGIKFDLFSLEEVIEWLDSNFALYYLPASRLLKISGLPYRHFTIECISELIPWLDDAHISAGKSVVNEHLQSLVIPYAVFSHSAIRLMNICSNYCRIINMDTMRSLLSSMRWNLPETASGLRYFTVVNLAGVYRLFDNYYTFPNEREKTRFTRLLLQLIPGIRSDEERQLVIEKLLFVDIRASKYPLSNLQFRDKLIDYYVDILSAQFGKDNGGEAYYSQCSRVIERIIARASNRDRLSLLSKLLIRIEAQPRLCEMVGMTLEPEKYLSASGSRANNHDGSITMLSSISSLLGEKKEDQMKFIEFLSTPISDETLKCFSDYLISRGLEERVVGRLVDTLSINIKAKHRDNAMEIVLPTIYYLFWDRSLEERAVIVDHLLIPASCVLSEADASKAYMESVAYIGNRLFPQAGIKGSDDEFALSFLIAYLDAADKYLRNILLSGMLIAANESRQGGQTMSTGKKLALLCEHMGPAYVKLAQAIHSYPGTPESIRHDLRHVKGRANPPHRWHLCRMIGEVLPKAEQEKIAHVGKLLGCASYNLALEVKLTDKRRVVLLMLRENAEKEARNGFQHLQRSMNGCQHQRLVEMRSAALAMLHEAEILSELEMDHVKSRQQYKIADNLYRHKMQSVGHYTVNIFPARLINSGRGYRFIEYVAGHEFNDLPAESSMDKRIRKTVAKAVMVIEFINIMRGKYFDSDRHGNQLRVDVDHDKKEINVGLYDFGEMALEMPSLTDIRQLADVLKSVPQAALKNLSFAKALDNLLANRIATLTEKGVNARYLMRVRKGLLALQDFQKQLSNREMASVLKCVVRSDEIHNEIRDALSVCAKLIAVADVGMTIKDLIKIKGHFKEPQTGLEKIHIKMNNPRKYQ